VTDQVHQQADPAQSEVQDARAEEEAQTSAPADPEKDRGTLLRELEEARQQAAESHDRFLRAHADMDNFRKRMERTYTDRVHSAKKEILRKLLGVKDNLERAVQYGSSAQAGEGVLEGVKLTQYQLEQILQSEGVQGIEALGKPFDPHYEEAVQSVNDPDVPDHTVVQVVRAGYTYGDEVLRPAQVIVSVHGEEGD
jgi:molecular chaperone GrpE